nr:MAG TPA: Cell-membrane associated Mucin15 [Caudoviricetes sp.]
MENLDNKTIIGGALGILGGIAGTLIAQYAFKKRKESIDRQQKQSKPYYNKKQKQNANPNSNNTNQENTNKEAGADNKGNKNQNQQPAQKNNNSDK